MESKVSLKSMYKQVTSEEQLADLSQFFTCRLAIPNATIEDVIEELELLSENDETDFDRIKGVYTYLSKLDIRSSKDKLRMAFGHQSLIFATKMGEGGWYTASECLWSSSTDIRGRVAIDEHYEELETLFITVLGIECLTLQMVYDDLKNDRHSSLSAVRSLLWSFTSLLQTEQESVDRQPLLKANIFAVKYPGGTTQLRSAETEFAIPDREHLSTRFKDKVKMLDFSLEDLRFLGPFLKWAGLDYRRLSNSVEQITSVSASQTYPIGSVHRDLKHKAHAILR
jgi:hypothetical protein